MIETIEAIQMCPVPVVPVVSLNKIGYMHPLSGGQIHVQMPRSYVELATGLTQTFQIDSVSQVVIYAEVPDDVDLAVGLQKMGAI